MAIARHDILNWRVGLIGLSVVLIGWQMQILLAEQPEQLKLPLPEPGEKGSTPPPPPPPPPENDPPWPPGTPYHLQKWG